MTGTPAPTIAVTSGGLPTGLLLSSSGVISGTPTVPGNFTGTVTATNSTGLSSTQPFSIDIVAVSPIAPVINAEPSFTAGTSNTVSWNTVNGAVLYEVQASADGLFDDAIDSGWISGTSYTFNGLAVGTTYSYRVRERNSSSPDGGWSQATQTDFNSDTFSSVTNGGVNFYVMDLANDTIRNMTPGGTVTTFAGTAGVSGSTDGTGSSARFNSPYCGVVDSSGNLYLTDEDNDTIRKVTPGGVVTTLAGLAGSSGSTDGTGSAARFYLPSGITIDSNGNLYVADLGNDTIRKVTLAGVVTTIAGSPGVSGAIDGTGSAARFYEPDGLTVDAGNNLYVTDFENDTIRKITPGAVVTTIAGSARASGSTDGTGSAARFYLPNLVAIDGQGNLYVTDSGNNTIRMITPGAVVTTLAGLAGSSGSSDGTGSAARFNTPVGVSPNGPSGITLSSPGGIYTSSGTLVSTAISPSPLQLWGILSFRDDVSGSGTALTVDVLNSAGTLLAANVGSGTDLSTLPAVAGVSAIRLRANLSTSNTANTPKLNSWSVTYDEIVFRKA
jgi:sugar lactone lactonase YvrE